MLLTGFLARDVYEVFVMTYSNFQHLERQSYLLLGNRLLFWARVSRHVAFKPTLKHEKGTFVKAYMYVQVYLSVVLRFPMKPPFICLRDISAQSQLCETYKRWGIKLKRTTSTASRMKKQCKTRGPGTLDTPVDPNPIQQPCLCLISMQRKLHRFALQSAVSEFQAKLQTNANNFEALSR